MISLRDSSFYEILPPNLKTPRTKALSFAFDRQMRELADYIPITLTLALVDSMTEVLCDQVALNYNIQEYRLSMSLTTKRELIKFAFQVSARRGTNWAVERLVSSVFHAAADTEEWFEYGGEPYFFRVVSSHIPQTMDELEDIIDRINETKNVRSWLESIVLELRASGNIYAGMVYHDVATETSRLLTDMSCLNPPPSFAYAGVVYHDISTETHRLIGGDS